MVVKTIKYENVVDSIHIAYGLAIVLSLIAIEGGLLAGVMTWIILFLGITVIASLYRKKYIYPHVENEAFLHHVKDDVMTMVLFWYGVGTFIGSVVGYLYFLFSYAPYNATFGAIAIVLGLVLFILVFPFSIIGAFLMGAMVEPYETESEEVWRTQRRRAILWGFMIAFTVGIIMLFASKALSKDK